MKWSVLSFLIDDKWDVKKILIISETNLTFKCNEPYKD